MVYHIVCGPACGPWAVRRGRVCGVTVDLLLLEACSELGDEQWLLFTQSPVRMESVKLKSVRRS